MARHTVFGAAFALDVGIPVVARVLIAVFPPRIDPPPRALPRIPIHTRPVHEPERVGPQAPPRRRIVVPHPVLVQARFRLEPLPGEAQVDRRAGGYMDPA